MKIYAIRDRMIDYYMQAFMAHSDREVQASIAKDLNGGQHVDKAIASAPHHFELHRLGEISEEGTVSANKEFICDLSSLIRRDIRSEEGGRPGKRASEGPANHRQGEARAPGGATDAERGPTEDTTYATPRTDA